jgi:hypothetical protein
MSGVLFYSTQQYLYSTTGTAVVDLQSEQSPRPRSPPPRLYVQRILFLVTISVRAAGGEKVKFLFFVRTEIRRRVGTRHARAGTPCARGVAQNSCLHDQTNKQFVNLQSKFANVHDAPVSGGLGLAPPPFRRAAQKARWRSRISPPRRSRPASRSRPSRSPSARGRRDGIQRRLSRRRSPVPAARASPPRGGRLHCHLRLSRGAGQPTDHHGHPKPQLVQQRCRRLQRALRFPLLVADSIPRMGPPRWRCGHTLLRQAGPRPRRPTLRTISLRGRRRGRRRRRLWAHIGGVCCGTAKSVLELALWSRAGSGVENCR